MGSLPTGQNVVCVPRLVGLVTPASVLYLASVLSELQPVFFLLTVPPIY